MLLQVLPYPSEDGACAIGKPSLLAYCAREQLALQPLLQAALRYAMSSYRQDNGQLWTGPRLRREDSAQLEALFMAHGLVVMLPPPVVLGETLVVAFPEQSGPDGLSWPALQAWCAARDDTPAHFLYMALWAYLAQRAGQVGSRAARDVAAGLPPFPSDDRYPGQG